MAIDIIRTIGTIIITLIIAVLGFCAFMMANALTDEYRAWEPESTDDDEENSETETQQNAEK